MMFDAMAIVTLALACAIAGIVAGREAGDWSSLDWSGRLYHYVAKTAFFGLIAWNVLMFGALIVTGVGAFALDVIA